VLEKNGFAHCLEGAQSKAQRSEFCSFGRIWGKSQQVDISGACTDSPESFSHVGRNVAKTTTSVVSDAVGYPCKFCRFAHEPNA